MEFQLAVRLRLKEGTLDPEAEVIQKALEKLGFTGIRELRQEKSFLIRVDAETQDAALQSGRQMAQKLLANLVMEDFEVEIVA